MIVKSFINPLMDGGKDLTFNDFIPTKYKKIN